MLSCCVFLTSCGVDTDSTGDGCQSDSDCDQSRVCADHVCRYTSDSENIIPASETAEIIFDSLKRNMPKRYELSWPQQSDYAWGFSLSYSEGIFDEQQLQLMMSHQDGLIEDYDKLMEKLDLSEAEFTGFEPGIYKPIPEGEQRALRDLDMLKGSILSYELAGEKKTLLIEKLIMLKNRWCLFDLSKD